MYDSRLVQLCSSIRISGVRSRTADHVQQQQQQQQLTAQYGPSCREGEGRLLEIRAIATFGSSPYSTQSIAVRVVPSVSLLLKMLLVLNFGSTR